MLLLVCRFFKISKRYCWYAVCLISVVGRRLQTVNAEYLHYEMSNTVSAFSGITTDGIFSLVRKCPTKSSALDPLPTPLVKANIDILAPTLATIINMLLESGSVPTNFKHAVITPPLKKHNFDPDSLNNYRPNLSFVSKLLERHVAVQLRQHLDNNNVLDTFQSAYRQHHSTETALVRIQNDYLHSLDRRKGVLAVLLDMSAAFDTIDHSMLISQLPIQGTALKWLESYKSNRTQTVCREY